MAERFLHMKKLNASQRRCLAQGKMVMKTDEGKIHCGKKTILTGKDLAKAKDLLQSATVERLKSFLVMKGFHNFSHLRKQELINLIFRYTDPYTGDVILHSPRKSSRKLSKESGQRRRAKESRGKQR